jgi:hypothetical protein
MLGFEKGYFMNRILYIALFIIILNNYVLLII